MTQGPKAPKDPEKKRSSFYIFKDREIAAGIEPDGSGAAYLYMDDDRMVESARMTGGITDEGILSMLRSAEGFRKLVYSIGVTVEEEQKESAEFIFQMYGKKDPYVTGTLLRLPVAADGSEHVLPLDECTWSPDDNVPGQIRFVFPHPGTLARISVRFYLQDGFTAPEPEEEQEVNFSSPLYEQMIEKSLMQIGNPWRLKRVMKRARAGEAVKIAFLGGSITQGAGAAPINTACYAWRAYLGFCEVSGVKPGENVSYCKAGVGGTPSELGLIRYDRDVCLNGEAPPDLVVVEFAVNDDGDETKGECYDSLIRKILSSPNEPAVILLFSVFSDDWNLQERLSPVGRAYELPMVSIKDAVVEQFYKKPGEGRVISKPQFFFDRYHPSNFGHRIMGDALTHLFRITEESSYEGEPLSIDGIAPPLGGSFEHTLLLDRKECGEAVFIDCGDFSGTDTDIQLVERDCNLSPTPEFPYNWKHVKGSVPFLMEIACSSLFIVTKDSASAGAGCAEVFADGEKILTIDPKEVGWTHCNARLIFRDREPATRLIEVRMCPGEEEKEFTILGFGYVRKRQV